MLKPSLLSECMIFYVFVCERECVIANECILNVHECECEWMWMWMWMYECMCESVVENVCKCSENVNL